MAICVMFMERPSLLQIRDTGNNLPRDVPHPTASPRETAVMRPLPVEFKRGVGRLRRNPPGRILADLARAARLRRADPPLRELSPRPERLVFTLTTVPERAAMIRPTLRSLLDQTCPADRIILAWPERKRDGTLYPPAPALPRGVDLLPCVDEGPATKILPALRIEPDAALIAVDDDVIYPANYLATLLAAHRTDRAAAWGWRGCRIRPGTDPRDFDHVFATALTAPAAVDVLMGVWGYLVPAGALDGAVQDFTGWPEALRWADDFWISGQMARRKVSRRVVPAKGLPLKTRAASTAALYQGPNRSGQNERIAIEAFREWW